MKIVKGIHIPQTPMEWRLTCDVSQLNSKLLAGIAKFDNWWKAKKGSLQHFDEDIKQDEVSKYLGEIVQLYKFLDTIPEEEQGEVMYRVAQVLVLNAAKTCQIPIALAHTLADYMEF